MNFNSSRIAVVPNFNAFLSLKGFASGCVSHLFLHELLTYHLIIRWY